MSVRIEDHVQHLDENDDLLSEDKVMSRSMESIIRSLGELKESYKNLEMSNKDIKRSNKNLKDRIEVLETENTVLKEDIAVLKGDNTVLKGDNAVLYERLGSLETFTGVPFIRNICAQILKHISGNENFRNSTTSTFFSNIQDGEHLDMRSYVSTNKYDFAKFCSLANKCIQKRNNIFHPATFDSLRKDARIALSFIAKSQALRKQLKFECIVLEIVNDQDMINAYFSSGITEPGTEPGPCIETKIDNVRQGAVTARHKWIPISQSLPEATKQKS